MIERVAWAIAKRRMEADQRRAEQGGCDILLVIDGYLPATREDARVAIFAMREPTGLMWCAGAAHTGMGNTAVIYTAMIDAALKDG